LFYIDGEINENILQMCKDILQEMRNLNSSFEISMDICRMDYPDRLPMHDLNWIYLRKEPTSQTH